MIQVLIYQNVNPTKAAIKIVVTNKLFKYILDNQFKEGAKQYEIEILTHGRGLKQTEGDKELLRAYFFNTILK